MLSLPPFFIFVAGAALICLLPQRWQGRSSLIITIAALLNFLSISQGVYWEVAILDYKLTLGRVDTLGYLFCLLFHIAAVIAALFAVHVRDPIQNISALLYAGGAVGATLAGALISLFIFWEIMAVASSFLIWARRSPQSNAAGLRYLIVQVLSGVLLLSGTIVFYWEKGSTSFNTIGLDSFVGKLIFLAFGITIKV